MAEILQRFLFRMPRNRKRRRCRWASGAASTSSAGSGGSLQELFEIDSVQVDELREGPGGVFVMTRTRGRGRGSGIPNDVTQAHVLEVRDGRIARLAWFATREEGLAAAGLS